MRLQYVLAAGVAAMMCSGARAQMAVSTFGATDAVLCYQHAGDDLSRDADPCDSALQGALTSDDKKKTLVNRGIIRNRDSRLMDAIADFNAALDIDDGLAEAYLNRGNSYYLGGRNQRAIADYERSLQLGVMKPWAAWYNIGLAKDASGDAAGARAAYEKAIELYPDFALAKQKLGRS